MSLNEFDILICGAGISGLYCARRILEHSKGNGLPCRVGLIERRSCVGGRIRTARFEDYSATPLELGAMRFKEGQPIITSLVKEYNLTAIPFNMANTSYYLRGASFEYDGAFLNQSRYALASDEQGMSPGQLLEYAIDRAIPRELWGYLERVRHDDILDRGVDFSEYVTEGKLENGLKNFLLTLISNEAFKLIKDGSGYDSSFHNWNAREAINHVINDFIKAPRSFGIAEGFEALPQALETDIVELGGEFFFGESLITFSRNPIENEKPVRCIVSKVECDERYEILTNQLILALPKRDIINITRDVPEFRVGEVHNLIHLVSTQPATKVFLSFSECWWEKTPQQTDLTITDMPLRKVYYSLTQKNSQTKSGGILLAVYADMDDFYYWDGYMGGNSSEVTKGSREMEQAIIRMLGEIHGCNVPDPSNSMVIRWSHDNAGAAFHAWKPGMDCNQAMEQILKPVKDLPVFICGEAYSRYQCWVEGALYSSEKLLTRYFDIEPLIKTSSLEVKRDFDQK